MWEERVVKENSIYVVPVEHLGGWFSWAELEFKARGTDYGNDQQMDGSGSHGNAGLSQEKHVKNEAWVDKKSAREMPKCNAQIMDKNKDVLGYKKRKRFKKEGG